MSLEENLEKEAEKKGLTGKEKQRYIGGTIENLRKKGKLSMTRGKKKTEEKKTRPKGVPENTDLREKNNGVTWYSHGNVHYIVDKEGKVHEQTGGNGRVVFNKYAHGRAVYDLNSPDYSTPEKQPEPQKPQFSQHYLETKARIKREDEEKAKRAQYAEDFRLKKEKEEEQEVEKLKASHRHASTWTRTEMNRVKRVEKRQAEEQKKRKAAMPKEEKYYVRRTRFPGSLAASSTRKNDNQDDLTKAQIDSLWQNSPASIYKSIKVYSETTHKIVASRISDKEKWRKPGEKP